jgi:hypothetical protein
MAIKSLKIEPYTSPLTCHLSLCIFFEIALIDIATLRAPLLSTLSFLISNPWFFGWQHVRQRQEAVQARHHPQSQCRATHGSACNKRNRAAKASAYPGERLKARVSQGARRCGEEIKQRKWIARSQEAARFKDC